MKIVYICADLGIPLEGSKGASAHVRGFVRALCELGHEVLILTPHPGSEACLPAATGRIFLPQYLQHLPDEDPRLVRALSHISNNVCLENSLLHAINNFRPDLIYERYSPFIAAGAALSQAHAIPHVLEVNSLLSQEGKQFRKQALQEASEYLEKTALQATGLIVTVSDGLKDLLVVAGVPEQKIAVVANGFDDRLFPPRNITQIQQESRFVIGFVGSLKQWHDIPLLASAFRLLAVDPRAHLLIVGDGPMRKVIEDLKQELPGRVSITGNVPHNAVAEFVYSMDIAVAPYPAMENFYFSPLKLFEYMAAGRAIVASGTGQVRELIRNENNGLLVKPADVQEFAAAIRRLIDDEPLRYTIARNAATEAHQKHTWRSRAQLILNRARAGTMTATPKSAIRELT